MTIETLNSSMCSAILTCLPFVLFEAVFIRQVTNVHFDARRDTSVRVFKAVTQNTRKTYVHKIM